MRNPVLRTIARFLFLLCLNGLPAHAQHIERDNTEWMRFLEEMAGEENVDNESLADLFDELSQRTENPYNLHTVTKEELESLPFLTARQVEDLLYYVYVYRPLVDLSELKNVETLDMQSIARLLPFVYIGDMPSSAAQDQAPLRWQHSRQELRLRTRFTLQPKAGYRDSTYLGEPYYGSFFYGFNLRDRILFAIAGEKDAGEKGLDYTTFNFNFKKLGIVEDLHLGNYRLRFGQGLVMNTHFSMGKTSDAINLHPRNSGIQRHISTNESQYFSGAAGTLRKGNLRLHLFLSRRHQDASGDDSTIYTFQTDGYHRTANELLKRGTARVDLHGTHLQWRTTRWELGLTGVHYSFGGKELNPSPQPYNLYYLRGKSHANVGLSYSYRSSLFHFQGETAADRAGRIATLGSLTCHPAPTIDGVIAFRHYDKQYNALYGNGFSESGVIRNETGIYAGIRLHPIRRWELTAYIDRFTFPWLRYGVDTPSDGVDLLLQLKYTYRTKHAMELRYKYKEKPTATTDDEQHRWLCRWSYSPTKVFRMDTQINYNRRYDPAHNRQGWTWTQTLSLRPTADRFQLDGGATYFHTDDWATRITLYERNVFRAFAFPTHYGQGLRYYATAKWKPNRPLTLYLKCGSTRYFDRQAISSGPEAIEGREKTDIDCLVRYTF